MGEKKRERERGGRGEREGGVILAQSTVNAWLLESLKRAEEKITRPNPLFPPS